MRPRFSNYFNVGWYSILAVMFIVMVSMVVVNCNNSRPIQPQYPQPYQDQYYQNYGGSDFDFYHIYQGTHYPQRHFYDYNNPQKVYVVPSTIVNPSYRGWQTNEISYPIRRSSTTSTTSSRNYRPTTGSSTSKATRPGSDARTGFGSTTRSTATRPGPDARTGFGSTRPKSSATLGTSRTSSYQERKASTSSRSSRSSTSSSSRSSRPSGFSSSSRSNPRSSSSRPSTSRSSSSSSSRKRN